MFHIFSLVCFLIYGVIWGNPQAATGATLEGRAQSQPFKSLYKNPLEIPKGIPSLEKILCRLVVFFRIYIFFSPNVSTFQTQTSLLMTE